MLVLVLVAVVVPLLLVLVPTYGLCSSSCCL